MDWLFDILKDWKSYIIPVVGAIGGFWVYVRHDRKIKSQEEIINDLQIKQLSKVEDENKKAEIKCNFIHSKGGGRIRFVNAGKSDARNVQVKILTPEEELGGILMYDDWGGYDLINPQSFREELIGLCIGSPDVIKMKVTWEDDYSQDRSTILSVPL